MKIREVTEGFWDAAKNVGGQVAKNLAKQAMGQTAYDATFDRNAPTRNYGYYDSTANLPMKGTVYAVQDPTGHTFFKSYQGKWYSQDPANPDVFNISQEVTDTKRLEDLLSNADKDDVTVNVTQGPNASTFFRADDTPKSTPAKQPTASTPQDTGGWIPTPDGVQVKPGGRSRPTFARYNKQIYRLTNDDRWVDIRDKPVSATMVALLNHALEQT